MQGFVELLIKNFKQFKIYRVKKGDLFLTSLASSLR